MSSTNLNIGLASTVFPWPTRNGVDIALAAYAEYLSIRHDFTFILIVEPGTPLADQEMSRAQASPWPVVIVSARRPTRRRQLIDELLLRRPSYSAWDYSLADIKRQFSSRPFDLLIASPVGAGSFCQVYRQALGYHPVTTLWMSDVVWSSYLEQGLSYWRGWEELSWQAFGRLLRAPLLRWYERRLAYQYDSIRLVTEREATIFRRLFRRTSPPCQIIVNGNGAKDELLALPIQLNDNHDVVLLSHFCNGRERQAVRFITAVWPLVHQAAPTARLRVIGQPPTGHYLKQLKQLPNVSIEGFVPNFAEAFVGAAVGVVAIQQQYGMITRAIDCLAAGVPMVISKTAASTIDGFRDQVHGLIASQPKEFARSIQQLLNNPEQRQQLATSGRQLVQERYTWDKLIPAVEQELVKLIEQHQSLS